jgi:hypothetical protein
MTERLKTFAPNTSCEAVSAKLRGGELGRQFVTAEIAAERADACAGAPWELPAAAEPFPLVEVPPRTWVLTDFIPSRNLTLGTTA